MSDVTLTLPAMTPAEVKVAAKQLIDGGYASRKVEEILGINYTTALRYAEIPIPEELQQFATMFDNFIRESKQQGIVMAQKRLLELLPKERRIDQVVKAAEYLEGKNSNNGPVVNIGAKADEMSITIE